MDNYGAGIVTDGEAWTRSIFAGICNEFTTKPAGTRTSRNVQVIMNSLLNTETAAVRRTRTSESKAVLRFNNHCVTS